MKFQIRRGNDVPTSKLTLKQARFAIRCHRFGISQKRIAERLQVSAPAIHQIIHRKGWKHA
jgi:DNA-binding MarR family transcriptional regulator